jgi:hypothetical protein
MVMPFTSSLHALRILKYLQTKEESSGRHCLFEIKKDFMTRDLEKKIDKNEKKIDKNEKKIEKNNQKLRKRKFNKFLINFNFNGFNFLKHKKLFNSSKN